MLKIEPAGPLAPQPDLVLWVGVVARDPLRLLGLQAIIEGTGQGSTAVFGRGVRVIPLTVPRLLDHPELTLVMIDATCTGHLLPLLVTLRAERPQLRVIVIGDSTEQAYIQEVIGAGAKGYLTQEAGENEIRMAMEIVCDGSVWAPRKVLARLLERRAEARLPGVERRLGFTDREIVVLRHLVAGMGNREIAAEMAIDESTVKAHLSRLMRKVGAKNRVELTVQALAQRFTERRNGFTNV